MAEHYSVKAMENSSVSKYYSGMYAVKFTCELMTDTRDFLSKLSEQVAGFTAACNNKIEKSEYAEYGLGKEMYYKLTREMVGEISMAFLKSQAELDKADGPLATLSTWMKERETTTLKVNDLADTFYRAVTTQHRQESEVLRAQTLYYRRVKKFNKAREELESLENNAHRSTPEAQWYKTIAKQERKISSRASKVKIAKENYQESLDEEFANRPPFVKAVLSEKEWLEDIEEERYCVLKTAALSFVDAMRLVQIEKFDGCSRRCDKIRNEVLGLDSKSMYNLTHGSYLKNYQFPEFQEYSKTDYRGGSSTLFQKTKLTGNKLVVEKSGLSAKTGSTERILPSYCADKSIGRDTDLGNCSFERLISPDKRSHSSDASASFSHKRALKANCDSDHSTNAQSENVDTNDIPIIPDSCMSSSGEECKVNVTNDASNVSRGKVITLVPYTATSKGHLTLKTGQLVNQICAANTDGFAYGWVRKNKLYKKKGYYPAKCVMLVN